MIEPNRTEKLQIGEPDDWNHPMLAGIPNVKSWQERDAIISRWASSEEEVPAKAGRADVR
jgi:hypothetical protein